MKKAFTTIEMIIMISLLAILMVMIVPNFITYLDNISTSEYASAKRTVEMATQKYIDDNGGFENLSTNTVDITNLKNNKYLDQKTLDVLARYADGGQAGTSVDKTNYNKNVCVDRNAKTIVYNISGSC